MDTAVGGLASYSLLSWPGGDWQTTVRFIAAALITYVVALWIAMVWWTYRDSRERTRDPFMQALAVFLVLFFNFAGLVIYLLTRPRHTLAEAYARTLEEEALLQDLEDLKGCPTCRRRVEDDYVICPTCQTQLKEPCGRCSKPLSYSWAACPFCAQPRRAAIAQPRRAAAAAAAPATTEAATLTARRPAAANGTAPTVARPVTSEEPV